MYGWKIVYLRASLYSHKDLHVDTLFLCCNKTWVRKWWGMSVGGRLDVLHMISLGMRLNNMGCTMTRVVLWCDHAFLVCMTYGMVYREKEGNAVSPPSTSFLYPGVRMLGCADADCRRGDGRGVMSLSPLLCQIAHPPA